MKPTTFSSLKSLKLNLSWQLHPYNIQSQLIKLLAAPGLCHITISAIQETFHLTRKPVQPIWNQLTHITFTSSILDRYFSILLSQCPNLVFSHFMVTSSHWSDVNEWSWITKISFFLASNHWQSTILVPMRPWDPYSMPSGPQLWQGFHINGIVTLALMIISPPCQHPLSPFSPIQLSLPISYLMVHYHHEISRSACNMESRSLISFSATPPIQTHLVKYFILAILTKMWYMRTFSIEAPIDWFIDCHSIAETRISGRVQSSEFYGWRPPWLDYKMHQCFQTRWNNSSQIC